MALSDVADKLDTAEQIANDLPESATRDRLIEVLGTAYKLLVQAGGEIVAILDEAQNTLRDAREETDL